MRKDVLFRGCTRPPMIMGVPLVPFILAVGASMLLFVWIHWTCLLLMPLSILVMREMAKRDEMVFRLMGLRLQFRTKVRNLAHHDGMWSFSPNIHRQRLEGED